MSRAIMISTRAAVTTRRRHQLSVPLDIVVSVAMHIHSVALALVWEGGPELEANFCLVAG
jgi:hypothetical protein